MEKSFFQNTRKDIETELAEIDVSGFKVNLGEILPQEEVVGEFNDFEKRAFIWHIQMVEEIKKVSEQNQATGPLPLLESLQFQLETIIFMNKSYAIGSRAINSLNQRFRGKGKAFLFRENFKVVISSKSPEDLEIDLQKEEAKLRSIFSFSQGSVQ